MGPQLDPWGGVLKILFIFQTPYSLSTRKCVWIVYDTWKRLWVRFQFSIF